MVVLTEQFVLGIFAFAFTTSVTHCLSLGYNNKDVLGSDFTLLTPDEIQRLKYGINVEKREDDKKHGETSNKNINIQGPKNIVLVFARFPEFNNLATVENSKENAPVYFDFPVKSSVGTYYRPRNPTDQLLVVSPVLMSEKVAVNAKRGCKEALDEGVASLLNWAEHAKHMVTGFVSKPNKLQGNPPASTIKSVPVVKREIKDNSPSGGSAKQAVATTSGNTDVSKDEAASLQTNEVSPLSDSHVGYLDEPPVKRPGLLNGGIVTLEIIQNGEKKEASIENAEPSPWDVFNMVNKMRRLWFESILNVMGFNLSDSVEEDLRAISGPPVSPLAEVTRTVLRDLQSSDEDNGFLLVVSAEDVDELKDAVQLVKEKTDPQDTLIVVTGQCPGEASTDVLKSNFWQFDPDNQLVFSTEQQRPTNLKRSEQLQKLPIYATGPKSDSLAAVKSLWGVPKAIQRLVRDRDAAKQKRSRPSNTDYMMKLPRNKFFSDNQNDNGLSQNSYFSDKNANNRRPPRPIEGMSRFNSDDRPLTRSKSRSRNNRNEGDESRNWHRDRNEDSRNWKEQDRDEVGEEVSRKDWREEHRDGDLDDDESRNSRNGDEVHNEEIRNWVERSRDGDIHHEESKNWREQPRNDDVHNEKSINLKEQLRPQQVVKQRDTKQHDSDEDKEIVIGDRDENYNAEREVVDTRMEEEVNGKGSKQKREADGPEMNQNSDQNRKTEEHEFWRQVVASPTSDDTNDAQGNCVQFSVLFWCLVVLSTLVLPVYNLHI